jgi:hypothetical protein
VWVPEIEISVITDRTWDGALLSGHPRRHHLAAAVKRAP